MPAVGDKYVAQKYGLSYDTLRKRLNSGLNPIWAIYKDKGIPEHIDWMILQWIEARTGIEASVLYHRINTRKWSYERAVSVPVKKYKSQPKNDSLLEYNGKLWTVKELADEYNIPYQTLYGRVFTRKMNVYDAIHKERKIGRQKK